MSLRERFPHSGLLVAAAGGHEYDDIVGMDEAEHLARLLLQRIRVERRGFHQGDATLQSGPLSLECRQLRCQIQLLLVELMLSLDTMVAAEGMKAEIGDGTGRPEKKRQLPEKRAKTSADNHGVRLAADG